MIFTFYSYKGGVGRSMALVNIATLLYQAGLKVLIVDWDLEAPGLERFFPDRVAQALESPGVIEMLLTYKGEASRFNPGRGRQLFPVCKVEDYLIDLSEKPSGSGRLRLLPSGRRAESQFAEYSNVVKTFDWQDFYENWEGEIYFEWLREEFEKIADVVLIDSRTGVTEMGGVCTYQLADAIVMFCGANEQNIDGTLQMVKSFSDPELQELRYGRPLRTVVVPARIEIISETTKLNNFRQRFSDTFARYIPAEFRANRDFFEQLEIPYVPLYAFEEIVAVNETSSMQRSLELEQAYERLLQVLVELTPRDSRMRRPGARRISIPELRLERDNLFIEASIFQDDETGEYVTRFKTSEGVAVAPFKLLLRPDIDEELAALRESIARNVRGMNLRTDQERDQPRAFGQNLFSSLFHGEALELYQACRRELESSVLVDPRLIIKIRPTTYDLANIPWELMCDPEQGFLAFDRRTPIIRFIPERPVRRLTFDPEWRILLVTSNPPDTKHLDLQAEAQQIRLAFQEIAPYVRLRIEDLPGPSPKKFRATLRNFDPHILHFIGHGGAGRLLLEDHAKNAAFAVPEANLTATVQNIPSLRLIYLNACETSVAKSQENSGLAYALSRAGIPAVVTNQFPAREDAAREIRDEFYRVLAGNLPVDEAVLWGRITVQGLRGGDSPNLEWATPILYLQASDAHLFKDLLQRQSPAPEHEYDVFISHSSADRVWVQDELLPHLEEAGLRVFIDYRDFEIGVPNLVNMDRALNNSRFTLIVLTPDWLESEWTEFESLLVGTDDPAARQRKLMPLLLKPCKMPSRIAMLTHADFTREAERGAQMERLVQSLASRQTYDRQAQTVAAGITPSTPGAGQGEDVRRLCEQLNAHRRNLKRLEEQRVRWDRRSPSPDTLSQPKEKSAIISQIEKEEATVKRLEEELAKLGEQVEYEFISPEPQSSEAGAESTDPISPDPKLQTLYNQAVEHFTNQEWDEAINFLEEITHTWPSFRDAKDLLQEARQEQGKIRQQQLHKQRLTALLDAARSHWQAGQEGEKSEWQKALDLLNDILVEKPDFAHGEAARLQNEVKTAYDAYLKDKKNRERLETLYGAAKRAAGEQNWEQAINLLESVVEDSPGYRDASALLQTATRQAHLADLYAQGESAYRSRNWAQAMEHFGNIESLQGDYRDVSVKLADARQQLRWDKLFDEGLAYLEHGDWNSAVEVLDQVQPDTGHRRGQMRDLAYAQAMQAYSQAMEKADQQVDCPADWEATISLLSPIVYDSPGYRDAARVSQEARRQARWAKLYEEAKQYAIKENWVAAIQTFELITRENTNYRDVREQLETAQARNRLAEHYEKGQRYLTWKSWQEARDEFQTVVDEDETYRDATTLLKRAEKEIRLAGHFAQAMQNYSDNQRVAAIASLQQVIDEDETYCDGEAKRLLAAWKKEVEVRIAYEEGKTYLERQEWRAAIQAFDRLFEIEREGYLDAGVELEKARLELRLQELYADATHLISDGQWEKAIITLKEIQTLREDYLNVPVLLEQVEEEHWLENLYQQTKQYQATEEWSKAAATLEKIQRRRPDYADTKDLQKEVRHQQQLAEWYTDARQAFENEDWARAVDLLQKIKAHVTGDYKDVAILYEHAERHRRLDELYEESDVALTDSDLEAAEAALSAAAEIDEGYRDVQVRLAQVRRQKRLLSLYNRARGAFTAGRWEESIEAYRQVLEIDPGYQDAERRLRESEYQKRLADFYAAGEQATAEEDWKKAITRYEAIVSLAPEYRDAEARLVRAKRSLQIQELYKSAIRFESKGDLVSALQQYQSIVELDPNLNDVTAKANELSKALELAQLYQKALQALEARRFTEGIPLLQEIVEREPEYEDVQHRLQQAIQDHRAALLERFQYAQRLKKEKRFRESSQEFEAYQYEKDSSPWLNRSNLT